MSAGVEMFMRAWMLTMGADWPQIQSGFDPRESKQVNRCYCSPGRTLDTTLCLATAQSIVLNGVRSYGRFDALL